MVYSAAASVNNSKSKVDAEDSNLAAPRFRFVDDEESKKFGAAEHVRAIHPSNSRSSGLRNGYVAFFQRIPSGETFQKQWFVNIDEAPSVAQSLVDLDRLRMADNLYVSMQTFRRKGSREIANLSTIGCNFIDLDFKKSACCEGQNPATEPDPTRVMTAVLGELDERAIPLPSFAMYSGRGLHIVWLHELLPPAALPRWNAVQNHLIVALRELGADRAARDAARVLRVARSWNTKIGREDAERGRVKLVWIQGKTQSPYRYAFDYLADEVLPLRRTQIAEVRAQRAKKKAKIEGRNTRTPSRRIDAASYGETVLDDLNRLRRHRYSAGHLPPGERDGWLFCACTALSWMTHPIALESKIIDLACEVADWRDGEARSSMGAILRRARDAVSGKTIIFNGKKVDPRYRMKAATIIEWLRITPEEMRGAGLRVLLSPDIRKDRKVECERERRMKNGATSHLSKRDDRHRIGRQAMWLIRDGLTYAQAASELGVSKATIGKAIDEVQRTFGPP